MQCVSKLVKSDVIIRRRRKHATLFNPPAWGNEQAHAHCLRSADFCNQSPLGLDQKLSTPQNDIVKQHFKSAF